MSRRRETTRETPEEVLRLANCSKTQFRMYVKEQICPFCERGPFKRLSSHTLQAHGINQWDIRMAGGFPRSEPICALEHSEKMSILYKPIPEESLAKGLNNLKLGSATPESRNRLGHITGARQRAYVRLAERYPDEYALLYDEELSNADLLL